MASFHRSGEATIEEPEGSLAQPSARTSILRAHFRPVAARLAIAPEATLFERRGFPDTRARPRLEAAGKAFVSGYNSAVAGRPLEAVLGVIVSHPAPLRGFCAEGTAMGAAIGSLRRPWRGDFRKLIDALAENYVHLAHVGVGWAMARLPLARRWFARPLDPLLAPLALDGWGFHDGYFRTEALLRGRRSLSGPRERLSIYDQGIGRSLWFVGGADPDRIVRAVAALEGDRHSDLWAGVGLAAVYAGGIGPTALETLIRAAGRHHRSMRQGAAFALAAHHRSSFVPDESASHAEAITRLGCAALLAIVESSFEIASSASLSPFLRYQFWRRLVIERMEGPP